jgi:hypothetical protein
MAEYDQHLDHLRKRAEEAASQAADLQEGVWPDASSRERLQEVLAYMRLVLETTDAALIAPPLVPQLEGALSQFVDSPGAVYQEFAAWLGVLLDCIARLPVARGREFEQQAKDAAATFQRSARQRFASLDGEARSIQQEIATARAQMDAIDSEIKTASAQRLDELGSSIDEIRTGFEQRLQGYESNLETEREEGLRLRGEQAAAFQNAEAERAAKAEEQLSGSRSNLELQLAGSKREVAALVDEIRRMKDDSEKLVGVIGAVGTAERYGQDAKEQRKIADFWRWVTVAFGLSAIGGVIAAILESNPAAETYAGKIALSVVLGGVATYAANQSKSHVIARSTRGICSLS